MRGILNNEAMLICIPDEELFQLRMDSEILSRLENGGVDNWENYSESIYDDELNDESLDDFETRIRKEIFGDNNGS